MRAAATGRQDRMVTLGRRKMLVASVSALVLGLSLQTGPASAQTAWTGTSSSDWFTAGNWTAGVPVAGQTATINTATPNSTIINQAGAVAGAMQIGVNGNDGGLTILGNGTLQSGSANIGSGAGAVSTVTVTGANAFWTLSGTPFVGLDNGTGSLLIVNGATVTSSGGQIGATAGATGAVVVGGGTWNVANTLNVGNAAQGTLSVTSGGRVDSTVGNVGLLSGSNGTATVASGATWETGELNVGFGGVGTLDVESGGVVTASNTQTVTIGRVAGSQGTVTVSGANSELNGGQFVILGRLGAGTLLVEDGGTVSSGNVIFANEAGATGTVTVTGADSTWQSSGIRIGGNAGASIATRSGTIDVLNGGRITTGELVVGAGAFSTGEVTVSGTGSSLSSSTLIVGQEGVGTLLIEAGGEVSATGRMDVGLQRSSRGTSTTTVAGGGSLLAVGGTIFVGAGFESAGVLQARDGGVVRATSISLGSGIDGSGTLVIGAASGDAAAAPGTIDVGTLDFGFGTGTLVFNHTASQGAALSFDAEVRSGNGNSTIRHLAGVTDFSGDGSAFNGTTSVLGGTLNVTGALGSTVSVQSGGTLGGTGTLETVTVADGTVAPGIGAGTLTTTSLTLGAASVLSYELGAPGTTGGAFNDLIVVGGAATLAGTVNVSALPAFGNGLYTLMQYGSATNNGIALGTTPDGFTYSLGVGGTAMTLNVAGGTAGASQFWDGSGTTANGAVDGGAGFWDASRTNWTVQDGSVNAAWGGEFAIFGGAAGVVNLVGEQAVTGMQFLIDGYRITPSNAVSRLVVNTPAANIRVGAGITAEIEAGFTGTGGIVKQEAGTLLLSGNSETFTGATTVAGGTLVLRGVLGGDATVRSGATLDAVSQFSGLVTVEAGGRLSPVANGAATLTLGSLALDAGSVLDINLGAAGITGGLSNDYIVVNGQAVLDGTLNIFALPGFGNGMYTPISYGSFVDNGIMLGTTPAGFNYALDVQSNALRLNVTSAAAGGNQFWDGSGPFGNGVVDGGTGLWSAGLTNWTDQNGNDIAAWGNDFAIFGGTAGTVTVVGPQTFTGMQFLTDGYTIAAGANGGLVTNTAQTNIRVGNGIAATIATGISGSGGLVKQEGGTLTITAGGSSRWRVAGGELVVEGDMASPAPAGAEVQTPLFALDTDTTLTIGSAGSIAVDPAYAGRAIEGLGGGTTVDVAGSVTAGGAEAILFRTPGAPSTVGDDLSAAIAVVNVEKVKIADAALNIFNEYLADPAAFDSSPRAVPPANTGSIFASGDLNEVNVGLTGQVTGTIAGSAGTSTRLDIDGGLLMTSADGTAAFILLPSTVATPGAAEIWLRNGGRIETTGASSAGVVLSPQTGSLVRIDGGSSIATSGNNSAGIAIDADSMVSHFESSGGGPTPIIETSGDNSPGFIARGAGSSVISFQVFGPDARLVTRGNDSDLFAVDMVEISSTSVLMQRASLLTQGDGSNAFSINGGDRPVAGDGSDVTLILQDVDTRTEGDNATALSIAERGSNSTTVFQFTRNNIETLGDGSSGLVYESENFLSSLMNLMAVETTVSTQGSDADGARIELGRFENSAGTYIFDDLSVSTAGDSSRGLVASFGTQPGSVIDFRMMDVGLTTSGAEAHGIVLEGLGRPDGTNTSELTLTNVSATVSGAGAHALVVGPNTSLTDDAARHSPQTAGGIGGLIDGFDGFVANGEGGRAIYNLGLIDGGADGIVLGAGIRGNIANGGTITAQGADAVTFGGTDDLFELLTTGVVTGDVRAGGGTDTFILGGTGAASFDVSLLDGDNTDDGEQYLGFETFEKRGASTWTLTGTNTEVDNLALLGGTALINGTLSSTAVSVGSGTILGGTGTIGSLIAMNGATVSPGNSIGTLTVTGDATFQTGSTYAVEIDAAGNADLLAVGGVAFLGGALAVDGLGYPVGYPADQDYTIITATGGVQGTFDQVTDNLPDVDVMATYNANDVVIGYRGATAPADMSAKEIYPNALQGSVRAAELFGDLMGERARIGGRPAAGMSGSVVTGYGPADRELAGGAASVYGVSTWAGIAGRTTDVNPNGGVPGYDGNLWGIASGVDTTFALGDGIGRAGLALGYTSADIGVGASAADAQAWHAGLYATWEAGPLGLSGALGYGWQDNDFSRAVALGGGGVMTATGSASGENAVVSATASWDVARQLGVRPDIGFRFAPTASVEHLWARRGGFTETGAGVLNLTVGPDSVAQTWLGIGIETSARFAMPNGVALTPSLAVMYEHNVGDRRTTTGSSIPAATAAFTTSGVLEDSGIVSLGAGFGVEFNERAMLKFGYSGEFSSNTTSHQGNVSFSLKF